ncbi:MAG TPA: methionyl-tRNA formyltransferase [Terriglobales bacterium]|nr:methionyl-tRNA formyltransferase [Terriglobales bacterium]
MDLIFCGTPQFAVPTLRVLAERGHTIQLVVTQPDRPSGRGMELGIPPVKQLALQLGVPMMQPEKIKSNAEFRARLEELRPEAIIVVGYGRILPHWMIDLPPLGNLNLHASLLPKYRGAAPIQWAIANGETVTGVTTMRIDAGLDTGDILLQRELPIFPDDTAVTLGPKLAEVGAELMAQTLDGLREGKITPEKQDEAQASLAPILKKEDGLIDFHCSATDTWNRMRGFQPWPGVYTAFRGKKLSITAARPIEPLNSTFAEAEIAIDHGRLLVGFGKSTVLELLEVQPEGKKRMSARDFINGHHPQSGEKLGR